MKYCLFQKVTTNHLRWNKNVLPESNKQYDLAENVIIKKCSKQKDTKLYFQDNYIIKETNKGEKKWISFENSVMTLVEDKIQDQIMQGIKLQYQEDIFEFYGDIELLSNFMKPYVIQTNFQQKFVLTKKLGKGNFASVYEARCKMSGNLFAAKIFEKQQLKNEVDIESLLKEISIMRILNHNQVMKLYEVFETNNHICVIIQQLSGGTLQDYLDKNSPLTESQAAQLIYSLLKPVYHLHELNIMHRDLKPENIIFRRYINFDQLCLADFGLAEIYSDDQKNYLFTRCGTPGFVAPEVLHDKNYNCQVDMYSLGVILYGAITGMYPFEGDYQTRVLKNYKGEINFDIVKLSQNGLDFLEGILEFSPDKRLNIREALNHQWFKDEKITKFCEFKIRKNLQPQHWNKQLHSPQLLKQSQLSSRTQCSTGSPCSLPKSIQNYSLAKCSPLQKLTPKIQLKSELFDVDSPSLSTRNEKQVSQKQQKNVSTVKQSLFRYSKPMLLV